MELIPFSNTRPSVCGREMIGNKFCLEQDSFVAHTSEGSWSFLVVLTLTWVIVISEKKH